MRKIQTTHESGFTLLELLLVVGVGALLLIGGIATYRQVTAGNQANQAQQTLLRTAASIRTAYQNQVDYAGLDAAAAEQTLIDLGIFPSVAAPPIPNAFGGEITVDTGAGNETFILEYTEVPQPACLNLGMAIQDPAEIEELVVNGTAIAPPITVAQLQANCVAGPNNGMNWELR
jgi:type II secretory pathway pseudopilin PulG